MIDVTRRKRTGSGRKAPSPFAIRRGRLIEGAMGERRMSGEQLLKKLRAKKIERTRTWLIALQNGGIENLSVPLCLALRDILGLNPTELTEDPAMLGNDFLPEATPMARWVGQHWDMLPKDLQDVLRGQIEAYLELRAAQPALDQIIRGKDAKIVPFDPRAKKGQ